ncbi:hypothetical protein D3C75_1139350 [compost metagenome]
MVLVRGFIEQADRQAAAFKVTGLAWREHHGQRQVAANAVGQHTGLFVYDTTYHCHMFAQLAVDQAAINVPKHFGRFEFRHGAIALGLEQQPRGHELQQHGDEG